MGCIISTYQKALAPTYLLELRHRALCLNLAVLIQCSWDMAAEKLRLDLVPVLVITNDRQKQMYAPNSVFCFTN